MLKRERLCVRVRVVGYGVRVSMLGLALGLEIGYRTINLSNVQMSKSDYPHLEF
jgi:hypothetical protein